MKASDLKRSSAIGIYGVADRDLYPEPGYVHDHSFCRMEDGEICSYLQLERFSRRKYDNRLHHYIDEWITSDVLDAGEETQWGFVNSFVGNAFLSLQGRMRFECAPRTAITARPSRGVAWLERAKWEGYAPQAYSIDHELAHVCANLPFHGAFKENSLLVHFDGGASLGNLSAFHYRGGSIQPIECHWKLGYLSKFFNDNALAFMILGHKPGEHCAVPGKLMGFATHGKPRAGMPEWLRSHAWFKDIWNNPAQFLAAARADWGWEGDIQDTRDAFMQDIAASFQDVFEADWLQKLAALQAETHADYLYLSGGCALNIIANTRIVESGMFQDVFIPPCPGDSGLSIGAAALLQWQGGIPIRPHSPYLNNAFLPNKKTTYELELVRQTAHMIAQGAIIGVCNGPGEVGPRALGNRSIIARADSTELARRVSMECKRREWYRPVAPVMREKEALRITKRTKIHPLSKYMLLDFNISLEMRTFVAGTVHVNGTARIQTLFQRADNPFLWDLLACLESEHGIYALINTSFNGPGEPIVHTAEHARSAAGRLQLDAVIINYELEQIRHLV